ncbi:HAD-IIB family hydrolase [Shewanella sp. A32]|uniref:HAD-IIB family hydrolase n=1 Tax=Shewanella sp. A32 TaxID=3031327 RepID=UPI0023B8B945|nr:HAD-IIB family hydrolase [Shewanella sp. A32]MDF0534050.1 HAD-IIB family hydrolase [Shewanella sp. A32]
MLLCTDLDRTLLPNGLQPESPQARRWFADAVKYPGVMLAYVSGRDLGLMQQAIVEYNLPLPDVAITDVGSMIYQREGQRYRPMPSWQSYIGEDWGTHNSHTLAQAIGELPNLQLQPKQQQQQYKLSYQIVPAAAMAEDLVLLEQQLQKLAIRAQMISSVDETSDMGLVDILPARAGKRQAIDFLAKTLVLTPPQVFFSGDSGNDLDVLISPYRTVLVKNATEEVVASAISGGKAQGNASSLYLAQGLPELGLNGYYSAGIVEGLFHFFPGLKAWLVAKRQSDE